MGDVRTVITSRSYQFKSALMSAGVVLAPAAGTVSVRATVLSPVTLVNTMPYTRSQGKVCAITDLYVRYFSQEPGGWAVSAVIASGPVPHDLGVDDYPIRVGEWSARSIASAPDWVRDFVADNEPSERIGS